MDHPATSLLTESPRAGLALASELALAILKILQPSSEIRDRLFAIYEDDATSVLMACQVTATTFQVVAAANGYWRDRT